jgi:hypothetical protein
MGLELFEDQPAAPSPTATTTAPGASSIRNIASQPQPTTEQSGLELFDEPKAEEPVEPGSMKSWIRAIGSVSLWQQTKKTAATLLEGAAQTFTPKGQEPARGFVEEDDTALQAFQKTMTGVADLINEEADKKIAADTPENMTRAQEIVVNGINSFAKNVPWLVAGAATGGAVGLMGLATQAGVDAYGEGIKKGFSHEQALGYGVNQGVIERATEALPFGSLIKIAKPAVKEAIWKPIARYFAADVPGEVLAEYLGHLNEKLVATNDETPTLEQVSKAAEEAWAQTDVVGTVGSTIVAGGGLVGTAKGLQKTGQAVEAVKSAVDIGPIAQEALQNAGAEKTIVPRTKLKSPDEAAEERIIEKAKRFGVKEEHLAEFREDLKPQKDVKTGWYQNDQLRPTIERAQEHTDLQNEPVVGVGMDIRNLAGMNAFFHKNHEKTDSDFFVPLVRIVEDEINRLPNVDAQFFRRSRGDELFAVVANADRPAVEQAMERASGRIQELVQNLGAAEIPHSKAAEGRTEKGAGLHFGVKEILPNRSPGDIISETDKIIDDKIGAANEQGSKIVETGTESSGGQAGGTSGGTQTAVSGSGPTGRDSASPNAGTPENAPGTGSPAATQEVTETPDDGGTGPFGPSSAGAAQGGIASVPQRLAKARTESPKEQGDPKLANVGQSEAVRSLVDVVDELRKTEKESIPLLDLFMDGWKKYQADPKGYRDAILKQPIPSAEQTLVTRELINQEGMAAIKSGDPDAIIDAAIFVSNYRQQGEEVARSLGSRRDVLKTPAERKREFGINAILMPDVDTLKKLKNAKSQDEKRKILEPHAKTVEKTKFAIERLGIDFEKESKRLIQAEKKITELQAKLDAALKAGKETAAIEGQMAEQRSIQISAENKVHRAIGAAQAAKADFSDKLYEYWLASILSAPTTHIANTLGNSANAAWDLTVQRMTEAALNTIFHDKSSATFGELVVMQKAVSRKMLLDAWRRARVAFDREGPVFSEEIGFNGQSKISDSKSGPAIEGDAGRFVRFPLRALVAADEMAKSIIWNLEVNAQAYRIAKGEGLTGEAFEKRFKELVTTKGSAASIAAYDKAVKLTFQEDLEGGKGILALRQQEKWSRWIIPFVTTPVNILKTAASKSPLGSLPYTSRLLKKGAYKLNLSKNAEWDYKRSEFIHDGAEQILAWATTAALYAALMGDDDGEPWLTGSAASYREQGKRAQQFRSTPPQSIRIGDKWYSYSRIEPMASMLTMTVDSLSALKDAKNDKEIGEVLAQVTKNMTSLVRDKTFLQGVGDIIRALEEPNFAVSWASSFASSWMPNIIKATARADDPVFRDYSPKGQGVAEFGANLLEKTGQRTVPFSGLAPEPKVDVWGREVQKGGPGLGATTDFLYRAMVPVNIQKADDNTVDRVILNWNNKYPNDGFYPAPPKKILDVKGEKIALTDEEYNRYAKEAGQRAFEILQKIDTLNPEKPKRWMIEVIDKVIQEQRKVAADVLFANTKKAEALKAAADKEALQNTQ